MVSPNDISQRFRELQDFIALGKIPDATKRLLDFVRDFSDSKDMLNEAVVICSNYNHLERQSRRGRIKYEDEELARSKLLFQILELMDDIMGDSSLNMVA